MKDIPHHMKKLNRRIIRSSLREAMAEEPELQFVRSEGEKRKMAKEKMRKERQSRTPIHLSEEERNRQMKKRVPIFDRNNAEPKRAKPTRKKTPRI